MAKQVTTASALTRLRPVSQPNIGGIVQEHIRYWAKNKSEEEAKELERQAKENEFRRKANEQAFKDFEGLQPEDNAGFLQSQIVARFEENKPYYVKLAKAAANGNMDAKLKLADEKRKIGSVVSANKNLFIIHSRCSMETIVRSGGIKLPNDITLMGVLS